MKSEGPIVAFEALIEVFASPSFAAKLNQATIHALESVASPDRTISLIDPPASMSTFEHGRVVLEWQRGELHFVDTMLLHKNSLISVMAVTQGTYDPTPVLQLLQRRVTERVDALKQSHLSLSPTAWQIIVGILVGTGGVVLAILLGELFGSTTGRISFYVLLAVALYVLVAPRLHRQRWSATLRRNLIQGDSDGAIRRALASIGIELPEVALPSR